MYFPRFGETFVSGIQVNKIGVALEVVLIHFWMQHACGSNFFLGLLRIGRRLKRRGWAMESPKLHHNPFGGEESRSVGWEEGPDLQQTCVRDIADRKTHYIFTQSKGTR